MKSLQLTAFAPPADSVQLVDVPGPRPGPDQALVAVEAAAINPSDFLIINGRYGTLPALPAGLGAEGVGVVIEVGSDVDRGRIGERVLLMSSTLTGTWSEQAVLAAADAMPVGGADPVQLAMLGINPATAYGLLRDVVPLRPGDWVVQTGGNAADAPRRPRRSPVSAMRSSSSTSTSARTSRRRSPVTRRRCCWTRSAARCRSRRRTPSVQVGRWSPTAR